MSEARQEEITPDYFFKRKVIVRQHKKGYRFSIDAPMLADFLPVLPDSDALEVGTGSGIVSLLALYMKKFNTIQALELQPQLSRLAAGNARENGFSQSLNIVTGDFNKVHANFTGIMHIFSNPPFYETNRGRLSPNPEIRDAKSETRLTLKQLISLAYATLGVNGSLYLVLPYDRYSQTIDIAAKTGFHITRFREIFSFKDGKPGRFLIQLSNYNVSCETLPPLIIFKEKGIYTEEMNRILVG